MRRSALTVAGRRMHAATADEEGVIVRRALGLDRSASIIATATPADRDRYLDLLRAVAITAVVIGHWLIAVIWLDHGRLRTSAALDLEPATQWLTWVVQVMPIFFLVGGVVNARSWRGARAAGGRWSAWMARRAARLRRPTVVLVWCWTLLGPGAALAGVDRDLIRLGAGAALVPLWFLAVYLLLIALVPALLVAYDRLGPLLLVGVLCGAAAGVDAAEAAGVPRVGLANYLVVWSVPTVLGFAWTDGTGNRWVLGPWMPVVALAGLLAAVTWFGYPISMVGLTGDNGPNTPSLALALLGCVQAGVAWALRAPARRWLARPGHWAAVARLNMVAMSVYLWHLTVLVLAAAVLPVTGSWWSVAPLSVTWWLTRPVWLLGLGLLLVVVVALLAPIEHGTLRPTDHRTATPSGSAAVGHPTGTALAVTIAVGAIAQLTLGGVLGWPAVVAAIGVTYAAAAVGAFASGRSHGASRTRADSDHPTSVASRSS